jgi:hypothetical protein
MMPERRCPACGEIKGAEAFGRNRTLPGGLSFYCLVCSRERNQKYYQQKRLRSGFVLREKDNSPEGHKRCAACREVKRVEEFHRASQQPGGRNAHCKPCRNARNTELRLQREYGLTGVEVAALIESQGGLCAICETKAAAHVDHCHATGKVRGVLCFTCNVALGQLNDDVALFRKAIEYLEGHQRG